MKKWIWIIAMMGFISSCALVQADQSIANRKRLQQAEPLAEFFLGIINSDIERFKTVFSQEAVLPPDRVILECFEMYRQAWKENISLMDPDNINFTYEGDRTKGDVTITLIDSGSIPYPVEISLPVVKEAGTWKLAKYSPDPSRGRKARHDRPIAQAHPLIEYIQAIKMDDLDGLKATYVENDDFPIADEEMVYEMKFLRFDLQGQYGFLYDPADFDYTYEGSDSEGQVIWTLPGGRSESFRVIKENDEWKLY